MGQAGHKIIVVDNDITDGFSMTRFSRYVSCSPNAKTKNNFVFTNFLECLTISLILHVHIPNFFSNFAVF